MEKKILPEPAVAEILEESYVEARLHTDKEIPGIDRIREVQARFAESIANPIYVTVEPEKERRLDRFEGATLPGQQDRFVRFLAESVEKAAAPKVVRR